MKKYQLGALTVSDKGLQDTKEEIVIELIDRMQKYVAEGKAAYENRAVSYTHLTLPTNSLV